MKQVLCGLICLGMTSHSVAGSVGTDQQGWIVGGSVGVAMLSIDPKSRPELLSVDKDAQLFTVYGGYNFTGWFGIEFDVSASSNFTDINTNLDAEVIGTSFSPKFTHHLNDKLGFYFKAGLQYIAYIQDVDSTYDDSITWNGIKPFFGAGLQYNIHPGVRARLDYKYSKLTLDRSENTLFSFDIYDDEIDLTFSAITLTLNYQF